MSVGAISNLNVSAYRTFRADPSAEETHKRATNEDLEKNHQTQQHAVVAKDSINGSEQKQHSSTAASIEQIQKLPGQKSESKSDLEETLEAETKINDGKSQEAEAVNNGQSNGNENKVGDEALSEDEQRQVEQLKERDREVRAHEQAHMASAGQYASGGPSYSFQTGPDGRRYAVGGEVSIDTSPIPDNPQATIIKANKIQAAASAPANPSAQDRAVAAQAAQMAAQARMQLQDQQSVESEVRRQQVAQSSTDNENSEDGDKNKSVKSKQDANSIQEPIQTRASQQYTQIQKLNDELHDEASAVLDSMV